MGKEKGVKMNLNIETSKFLDNLNYPKHELINALRHAILECEDLQENVKWNAPNYVYLDNDIITLKLFPPKKVQVILHRGAKVQDQPREKPLDTKYDIIEWKTNDRAIITFKDVSDFNTKLDIFKKVIRDWIDFIKAVK